MKEKAHLEIDSYRRFAKALICNYGTSEIYCHHGKGGILNSALVAVGMREGPAELKISENIPPAGRGTASSPCPSAWQPS